MRIAQFKTERVEYVLETTGYSRNDHYTEAKEMKLNTLKMGASAQFQYKIGETPYVITTDQVVEIKSCPPEFSSTVCVYRVRHRSNERDCIHYKIGLKHNIAAWAAERWPDDLISIELLPQGRRYMRKAN